MMLLVGLVYFLTRQPETPHLEHLLQAQAWLRGHWYIDPASVYEQVLFQGHAYIVHPLLSSVVMLVAWLLHFPYETKVCVLLGAVCVGLLQLLLNNLWLTACFAFGTDFWWAVSNGGPWQMTELLGVTCMLCALLALRAKRPLLVGLMLGFAVLSRAEYGLLIPLYAGIFWVWPLQSYST